MSADGTFSPDFYKAAGDAAIGMFHSSPDFSAFAGGYKGFLEKHQKKYGEKPIAPFHAHGYDAAMMMIPMKRHAQPDEMAGAALFLASEAGSFTNGSVIVVDGGATA